MKKSHRKDVIIARIIFAAMCIALIAIIIGVVSLINSHRGGQQSGYTDTADRKYGAGNFGSGTSAGF